MPPADDSYHDSDYGSDVLITLHSDIFQSSASQGRLYQFFNLSPQKLLFSTRLLVDYESTGLIMVWLKNFLISRSGIETSISPSFISLFLGIGQACHRAHEGIPSLRPATARAELGDVPGLTPTV